jgi:hypothetical protein
MEGNILIRNQGYLRSEFFQNNQQKKGQVSKENEQPDTKKCSPSNGQNALMGSCCSLEPVHWSLSTTPSV